MEKVMSDGTTAAISRSVDQKSPQLRTEMWSAHKILDKNPSQPTEIWSTDTILDKNPSQGTMSNRPLKVSTQSSNLSAKHMCWLAGNYYMEKGSLKN